MRAQPNYTVWYGEPQEGGFTATKHDPANCWPAAREFALRRYTEGCNNVMIMDRNHDIVTTADEIVAVEQYRESTVSYDAETPEQRNARLYPNLAAAGAV